MTDSSDHNLPHGLSVVIPVYNSEPTLLPLTDRLEATLGGLGIPFEVILVNDCSRDGSWIKIEELCSTHSWLVGLDLMRNYGQHNALLCGIRSARYAICVTIDDDLQNPPEQIPKLLSALKADVDVVYGTASALHHGHGRNLASRLTKFVLATSMGATVASKVSAFRAFRTQLRDAFRHYENPFVSLDVLLTWGTSRFDAIEVAHSPRAQGTSNYNFRKLITHAMNLMTGFSTRPLRVSSFIGFGFTAFGFLILAYVMVMYFMRGISVPGFAFLASIIAIFSGAQLFAMGIMGEYMARMHVRTLGQPPYLVRRSTSEERARD